MPYHALVPAAGNGFRFGAGIPKQYLPLRGKPVTLLRCGGATRAESVRNALDRVEGVAADDWIVVHDAVRPCLSREESLRLRQALEDDDVGGFLAVPVSDTLNAVQSRPSARSWRTSMRTSPFSVNLFALLPRLSNACRRRS